MRFLKIRMKRQRHAMRVPFSLIYLCKGEEVIHVKNIFETFLAFPIRHAVKSKWTRVRVEEFNGTAVGNLLGELVPDLLDIDANWHAVVPIMSTTRTSVKLPKEKRGTTAMDHRGETDLYKKSLPAEESPGPKYLLSEEWGNWQGGAGLPSPNPAFPPTAYFVTREQTFVPPCSACPRIGYHEAGECHLGDPECYTHLGKYNANARMFQKLREYDDIQESMSAVLEDESRPDHDQKP
jgi:hypothetical protein